MRMRWLIGLILGLTLLFSYLATSIAPSFADEGGDDIMRWACRVLSPVDACALLP
jgi:hypothetical protein